jgi:hypothetical protein
MLASQSTQIKIIFMDLFSDASARKTSVTGKDIGPHQASEKNVPHSSASQEIISKGKSSGAR